MLTRSEWEERRRQWVLFEEWKASQARVDRPGAEIAAELELPRDMAETSFRTGSTGPKGVPQRKPAGPDRVWRGTGRQNGRQCGE
jgi:hypothetical protein